MTGVFLCCQILYGVNPIDIEEWPDMPWYIKGYEVFKAPIMFFLICTVPVVKYDQEPLHNWNKYVNVWHLVIFLAIDVILIQAWGWKVADTVPMWVIGLAIGICLAIPCWFTSVTYRAPSYHEGFGYLAFLNAMVWIYVIATEIVNLLTAFGVVFQLSNGILGLTLLAWGNSVGDFVADMVMAKQGFPRMAFSACFGAPIFHLLLGTGISFIARMGQDGVTEMFVRLDTLLFVANVFTICSMLLSLLWLPLRKFFANKMYGICLEIFYAVFVVICVLCEAGVIPDEIR